MIGIITINHDTFTNPVLYSIIKNLNDYGQEVALFNDKQQYIKPSELNLVTYFNSPKGIQFPKRPDNFLKYLRLYWEVLKEIKKNKIVDVIAVDPVGLVIAGRIKRLYKNIRIHYFSFEIFFANEIQYYPNYIKLKKKEIFYTKNVSSIVIQDEVRKNLLIQENKISTKFNNWYLIPVAPSISNYAPNNLYNRVHYGLKNSDIVYVYSGSIASWSGIDELIKAIENGLPIDTYVLIHSKTKFDSAHAIHRKLLDLKLIEPNLILHDEIFEKYEDYLNFLKIFDFGIVTYKADGGIFTGKNIEEIGLSSGKFSTYMAAGLPSLLYQCSSYLKILKTYKIGVIVTEIEDLTFHFKNKSLTNFSKNECIDFYHKILDPKPNASLFIKKELLK